MMFNRSRIHAAALVAESNDRLGASIERANRELGDKLDDISKRETKAKDRVDISLEEYERMKADIRRLVNDNRYMRYVLSQLHMPLDIKIIPDTIVTSYMRDMKDFKRKYRIEFDTEDF